MKHLLFSLLCFSLFADFSKTYEFLLSPKDQSKQEFVWETETTPPFTELIVSWNGVRPSRGKWTILVSLWQGEWSPWLKYAEWTKESQKTFQSEQEGCFAKTFQDGAFPISGTCQGFRVQVLAEEGADLKELDSVYACVANLPQHAIFNPPSLSSVRLSQLFPQSQMLLPHPRHRDLCSPTSTSAAINCLLGEKQIDPVSFANRIHDDEFDIYGNWILNTAEASSHLLGKFRCHVERLRDFQALHQYLLEGTPVVVSVKGDLPGAPLPYDSGHLICIFGYEEEGKRVLCIDPAFPEIEQTVTSYALEDFLTAWGRRRNLGYIFSQVKEPLKETGS